MPSYLKKIILFATCSWALAYGQDSIEDLSKKSHWLKLLHFPDITSQDFYLASNGKNDPKAELIATIEALKHSHEAYCKYPARRVWVENQGHKIPKRECSEFNEWSRGNTVKSVSMVFATGYLGNPASFFGHPLLKFNFKDERSPLDLLDTAINYGAFTPPGIDALSYAVQGIFGGFEAGFTTADFFFHKNNYSELELRDMWEYELNLPKEAVQELVNHIWELRSAKLPYYFFSDNCAYRMSELMELVTEKKFVSKPTMVAIPINLFHKLHEYKLVSNLKHLSSRQTRLREKVYSLKNHEVKQLKLVAENADHIQNSDFKSMNENERSRVLETALDYVAFSAILDKDEKSIKEERIKLLKARMTLPPREPQWEKIKQHPPHESQKPVLTQVNYFYSDNFKSGGAVRIRPVFYDLVSPDTGRPALSSLAVMDTELNFNDEKVWLNNLSVIAIETLNVSKTGLQKDGGFAWKLKVGADQVNLDCRDCLVPVIQAGLGKAFELSPAFVFYGMIEPRLQSELQTYGHLALSPMLGALVSFSDDFRLSTYGERRFYLNKPNLHEDIFMLEGRLGSSKTWDVRLSYQIHVDSRYVVGTAFYW